MIKKFKSFLTIAVAIALCGAISVSSCSSKSTSGNDSTASEATEGEATDAVADSIAKAIAEIQPEFNEDLPFQQLASAAVVLEKYFDAGASKTVMEGIKDHVKSFEETLKNKPVKFESTKRGAIEVEEAYISSLSVQNGIIGVSVKYKAPKVEESVKRDVVAVDKDNKINCMTVETIQKSQIYGFYIKDPEDANIVKLVICDPEETKGKKIGDQCPL